MTKSYNYSFIAIWLCFSLLTTISVTGQEENEEPVFKNLVSTNLMLPIFESFDINYERTIANKWAIGLAGAIYGERSRDLSTASSYYDYKTNYEVMPFARIYFQGAQNKSHFVELFGSLSGVEESGRFIRSTNGAGYGVYSIGTKSYTVGGLGAGYGYRFLLCEKRLLLEAEFGVRTNFDAAFLFLNGAVVRTGIKVGYRF